MAFGSKLSSPRPSVNIGAAVTNLRKQQQVDSQKAAADKAAYDANAAKQNQQTMANAKTDIQKEQATLQVAGNDNTDMGKVLLAGAQGQQIGAQFFGEGSLGRIQEGFSSAESQAMLGKAQKESQDAYKQANRRLKLSQASSGMSGGAAAFQQSQIANEQASQQAAASRDLFLAQEAQRRQDIQFNLAQAAKEKAGRLSTTLGFMQMKQGLLTTDKSSQAIMNAPTAPGQSGGLLSGIFGGIF